MLASYFCFHSELRQAEGTSTFLYFNLFAADLNADGVPRDSV